MIKVRLTNKANNILKYEDWNEEFGDAETAKQMLTWHQKNCNIPSTNMDNWRHNWEQITGTGGILQFTERCFEKQLIEVYEC